MDVRELQDNWNRFGQTDPLWAILTDPTKKGGRWDSDGFFATGHAEIGEVMTYLQSLSAAPGRGRALDFGCGVGRLTQALCEYFDEVHGVDIAPSMIRHARRFNRFGARAIYHLNAKTDLSLFADGAFDFVYSNLVLQHMKPEYSRAYIREFLRVLRPAGVALFQLPDEHVLCDRSLEVVNDAAALPASALRARVRTEALPSEVTAGSNHEIRAWVTNLGDAVWRAVQDASGKYAIRLGNHWLDEHGRTVRINDGRTAIPRDIEPHEEACLTLQVRAPEVNGRYILEIDMVQEQVAWFETAGSEPARATVRVVGEEARGDRAAPSAPGRLDSLRRRIRHVRRRLGRRVAEPVMEMYGAPRPEVVQLIERSGGRVLDVAAFAIAGEKWTMYRYCAARA